MSVNEYDAVVVGGGIVGAVQALLLAQQGISTLLIEATLPEAITEPLQQRSVALSHRSFELLLARELWPTDVACPINEIHVTNRGSFGSARITALDLNAAALGYVVANHRLEHHLRQLVRSQKNIEFVQPATARLIHNSATGVELTVSPSRHGESRSVRVGDTQSDADAVPNHAVPDKDFTARCRLLIAADGTHSHIRQSLGLNVTQHDYDQVAVVANVECQLDHQHIAHERFTDSGPLALLPLSPRCMAMVYTAHAGDGDVLKTMPDEGFLRLLQARFGGKLGRFKAVGRRAVFPLTLSQSDSQTAGNCVLIGNSARTLHPVAGQGLNLALRDVFALAASVDRCFTPDSGQGLGNVAGHSRSDLSHVLAEFQRQRLSDQRNTVRRTDILARVFSDNKLPVLGPVRGAGLFLLNGLVPLRKRFAADSAGIGIPLGFDRESRSPK